MISLFRILTISLAAFPMSAAAADMTVAGMTLGTPIVTKPCENKYSTKFPCLLTDRVVQLGTNLWVAWIMLPDDHLPRIMTRRPIKAYSKSGALVGVSFATHGMRTQAYDLDDLTEKYGPPTSKEPLALQNRLGGNLEAVMAQWSLGDVRVSYISWMADYNEGQVIILTNAAEEVVAAEKALQPTRPRL